MRRILFSETDFNSLPNPPAGFKYIGFDGPNFSEKGDDGQITQSFGITGPTGPAGTGGSASTGDIAFDGAMIHHTLKTGTIYIDPSNDEDVSASIQIPGNSANSVPLLLENLYNGGIQLNSNNHNWIFGTDGKITLPDGGDILDSNGNSIISGLIDCTYDEITTSISENGLIPGTYYRITDFMTCYDQPDYNSERNAVLQGNYKTSDVHPIIVFATSDNTLSVDAFQPDYPNDTIKYDVSWNQTEITSGTAYGRITERVDEYGNRTDYDHRNVLFKRWKQYYFNWEQDLPGTVQISDYGTVSGTNSTFTSLSVNDIVIVPNYNDYLFYKITSIDSDTVMTVTGSVIPNTYSGLKLYTASNNGYVSYYADNTDPDDYVENYTFHDIDAYNNYFGNYGNVRNYEEFDFILPNNVMKGGDCNSNKFGDMCFNNTFDDDCSNNRIGDWFYNNGTNDDFDQNIIGNYFNRNIINANFNYNRIGEYFENNTIVNPSFYRNVIGNNFGYNFITDSDFQNNIIRNQFNSNKIFSEFYKNSIGNGFNNNTIQYQFYGNLIGNAFNENDIYLQFYDNQIGEYFENNEIGDVTNYINYYSFYRNVIGNGFYNNNIRRNFQNNQIANNYQNNNVYGSFYKNVIGNGFNYNNTGHDFYGNHIGNGFNNNDNIGDFFKNNQIGEYFASNYIALNFRENSIGNSFEDNTLGDTQYFTWNVTSIENLSSRTYDTFYNALFGNEGIQNFILGKELIMHDTVNNEYHKVKFTQWTPNGNGGGFSYERTKVYPTQESTVYFTKTNFGSEVDIIVEGSLEITRGNSDQGIYNAAEEGSWSGNPIGTEWNSIYTQYSFEFKENQIANGFKANLIYDDFTLNKIGYGFYSNEIYDYFDFNTIGNYFFDNNFNGSAQSNEIKDNFYGNTIGDNFNNNIIGLNFYENDIASLFSNNQIGKYFTNNQIAEGFGFGAGDSQNNVIADYFQDNSINEYFYNNKVASYFQDNTVGYYFQRNNIDTSIVEENFVVNYGNIVAFTYSSSGTTSTPGFYNGLAGTTNGYGIDATFGVTVSGGTISSVSLVSAGNQYAVGNTITIPGNSIEGQVGVILSFSSDGIGKDGTDNSYLGVTVSGGSGSNATFNIDVNSGVISGITLEDGGSGYIIGNTLSVYGSQFGGTDGVDDFTITVDSIYSDDITITITEVSERPSVYETYNCQIFERKGGDKRLSFYDDNDILTIKNINE